MTIYVSLLVIMVFIDTHTHLYLDAFDQDREQVIRAALDRQVNIMLLPNIDRSSISSMHLLCSQYPGICLPMIGLHPTSVKGDHMEEMQAIEDYIENQRYVAIGEMGMDLYWDRTYEKEQEQVFRRQVRLALDHHLPIVIHSRNAVDRIIALLKEEWDSRLTGVFHCFSGSLSQAVQITEMGLYLGIGGVLTFPKSNLDQVARQIGLEYLLLETDAPFLAPVPYRGKRNESAYLPLIAARLADVKGITVDEVAEVTTANARKLFNIDSTIL